jgi:hypothetical protein
MSAGKGGSYLLPEARKMLPEDIGWIELTPEEARIKAFEKRIARLEKRCDQLKYLLTIHIRARGHAEDPTRDMLS